MEKLNLFIYTETSLHAGTGSSVSVVDLPIQRERSTQYPLVQGSGVKGALRQQLKSDKTELSNEDKHVLFGYDKNRDDTRPDADKDGIFYAGALAVGDAQIVLFPVRSLVGVFAYVTCPHVLARIRRDVTHLPELKAANPERGHALITKPSTVSVGSQVVLEEFTFDTKSDDSVTQIAAWLADNALPTDDAYAYWRDKLKTSLVVLSDDDFRDFVVNSTEITTRVRLEAAKKTVAQGALWTEEALPSDTLLMSVVIVRDARKVIKYKDNREEKDGRKADVLADLTRQALSGARIQIGGDETTGSGFVALRAQ
jgi:CRISPR-associated protein Cmr4